MGVPAMEVGYTLATTRRGDRKVHKGHVVALEKNKNKYVCDFSPLHKTAQIELNSSSKNTQELNINFFYFQWF
jgi:hypothetical protein